MTESEIHEIARQAAREAVNETFLKLGLDPDKPMEAQQDMAFLRRWRQSTGTIQRQSLVTAVAIITAGILGLFWVAIRGGPAS